MLGHKLWQILSGESDAWVTVRSNYQSYARFGIFKRDRLLERVDASKLDTVVGAFAVSRPDVVVNCIGVVKQVPAAHDPIVSITVNSLFPHLLARQCRAADVRLIHVSTDCVFSGRKGNYSESDAPDPEDLYGRSKLLGELPQDEGLTLRTSLIGREMTSTNGLVEWFLRQQGHVQGYTKAAFSGFTTAAFARIVLDIILHDEDLTGIYHVASSRISKYDLLCLLRDVFKHEVVIEPSGDVVVDRSLDGTTFKRRTDISSPTWQDMIRELASDRTPYNEWRN
jgi:dTDP-4-dehydrorhamnose reductase